MKCGDFVYNRLFAWKGSFAVANVEDNDCYVSNEFPCFNINQERVDSQYLRRYFSRLSAWDEAFGLSTGGTPTSRNRLKQEKLLAMEIPLPSLEEQRRIVARIEELAARIEEARGLRRQATQELDSMCRAILFDDSLGTLTPTPMRQLVTLREPDIDVQPDENYHFAGVYSFGRGVFLGNVKSGMETKYKKLTKLHVGDFVYPKLMAWEGALGTVPPECANLVVSTEFPVFEVNEQKVLPEVLDVYFRSPSIWPSIGEASTGTNVRRRRLHPSAFQSLEFPLPPMHVQMKLREIISKIAPMREMQAQTSTELDAMLPSILDKAFKGEL